MKRIVEKYDFKTFGQAITCHETAEQSAERLKAGQQW